MLKFIHMFLHRPRACKNSKMTAALRDIMPADQTIVRPNKPQYDWLRSLLCLLCVCFRLFLGATLRLQ